MTRINGPWVLSLAFGVLTALAGEAYSTTLTNSTPIVIPGAGNSDGSANVYPSTISVAGLGGLITSVSVGIDNFSDTHPSNVELALVSPTGQAFVLQGDAYGTAQADHVNLLFSDAASSLPPQNGFLTSGTFKPAQFASIGSFPAPGPGLAYNSPQPFGTSTFLSTFFDTNPNGTWSLYAFDAVSGDTGQIAGGWNLQVNAVPEPASVSLIAIAAGVCLACRYGRRVLLNS